MLRNKDIIGQTFMTKSGFTATIIDGNNLKHLTIKFEDGTVKENISYWNLKNGKISHPTKSKKILDCIGETFTTNMGFNLKIINGYDKQHLTVQFEDGYIRKNIPYKNITRGEVGHPLHMRHKKDLKYIDKIFTTNTGCKVKVIGGTDANHLTIQFDDGSIRENIHYGNLQAGMVAHPTMTATTLKIIGKTRTLNSGLNAKIIGGTDANHLIIQFEDGAIKENIRHTDFIRGKIAHPNPIITCANKTFTLNSGLKATIIDGTNKRNLIVQFEDDETKTTTYKLLQKGQVNHPQLTEGSKQFHSIKLQHKYRRKNTCAYYDCTCTICNKNMLLTPIQLMNHHFTCRKENAKCS